RSCPRGRWLPWSGLLSSGQHVLPGSLAVGSLRAAEADAPGADELLQAVRSDELLERVDVLRRAGELEHDRVRPEIRDACVEDLAERHQLGPGARRRGDLQQRELALDR